MCLRPFLQPKQVQQRFQLPGSISLILNLHAVTEGFYQNKETLNLGLLTKEIRNYAKTPSRLGQLGQSVQHLQNSVSQIGVNETVEQLDVEQVVISRAEWEFI